MDDAFSAFQKLKSELTGREADISSEADARFQIIDRMLVEVLGWPRSLLKLEPHVEEGYIDYLLVREDVCFSLVEAKKTAVLLTSTQSKGRAVYKIGGPALRDADAALEQARSYCFKCGAPLACVTNGFTWIFDWTIRGDGKPSTAHKAIFFPSLDAVEASFANFYDLLSFESLERKTYRACFNEAEGLQVLTGEKLRSIRDPRDAKLMRRSELARDLDSVFKAFFSNMSGDADPEMLARCFVDSKESRDAEASLQKIAKNIVDNIQMMDSSQAEALHEDIKDAVQRGTKEFAVIVGNKGAGKSTFIDKFFDLTLDKAIRERCLVLKVDLRDSDGGLKGLQEWLTSQLIAKAERALFAKEILDYDDLQGIFYRQYKQWSEGEFKHLYSTDKTAFKVKFGEYMHQVREGDHRRYLESLLWHASGARRLLPCLIYDNADHFPQEFQEAVFQYAQSLYRLGTSFVICPITDRTIWQLSKSGPLQSYETKAFYLPVPSTKEVLEKRVAFIKSKVGSRNRQSEQYFLSKGIRISITDVEAFAACVEEIFINTEYVSRTISWLCNFDIRRSLMLTQKVLASPHISIDDLVKTYFSAQALRITEHAVRKALMLGDYTQYGPGANDFVLNLFQLYADCPSTPFIRLSILQLLKDRDAVKDEPEDAYMSLGEIETYLDAMGCAPIAVRKHAEKLLAYRCIEPYDPTETVPTPQTRLKITSSGLIHIELAVSDHTYIEHVGLTTEVRESPKIDEVRHLFARKAGRMDGGDWMAAVRLFAEYCVDQDLLFCALPSSYAGQLRVRHEFCAKWGVTA